MAKIVVQNDTNPDIGIVLTNNEGWRGQCTQCGWSIVRIGGYLAVRDAQQHVDTHDGEE